MSKFLVVEPCTTNNPDGSVTEHRESGAVVELSDEVAAELGSAVQRVEEAEATEEQPAEESSPARGVRGRGRRPSSDEPAGNVVNPLGSEEGESG